MTWDTHPETKRRASKHASRARSLAGALLVIGALALPVTAWADEPDTEAVTDQNAAALAEVGAAPAAPNEDARAPARGTGLAALDLGEAGRLTVDLPAKGEGRSEDGLTTVYDATAPGAAISVQPTRRGLRTLITIDDSSAPERYAFPIAGDVDRLDAPGNGSVIAYDASGTAIATLAEAWAVDAEGRVVPTHFEIRGTTIVQVVEHRGEGFAYPITADPWWNPFSWDWEKIGRAVVSGLKRCGTGALTGALGIAGGVVTINLIKQSAGTFMVRAAGGPYVYVAAAVAGCISKLL